MITSQQIQQFFEVGAVTIDTPLTETQIAAAAAAVDRLLPFRKPAEGQSPQYRYSMTCNYYDPALLDIIQHPFFEEVAKRVLKADAVNFFQTAILVNYPQPNVPFSFDQHVDIQYCISDYQTVPLTFKCSYFLWLTDVNDRRAPMMFRPGSHLLIAAERECDPALKGVVPCVKGVTLADLPPLDYAEPVPVMAKAGQVSVLTTSTVHGGSVNVDAEPRKVLVLTFIPANVEIGLPPNQAAQKRIYDEQLRKILRPERVHIVAE